MPRAAALRRRAGALVLLAAALIGPAMAGAGPTQESGGEFSAPEVRAMAVQAHHAQRPALARDMALALLQRDPGDSVALQVLAASYYALGQYPAAARAGRRAYGAAEAGGGRHDAAMIVAESLFKQQKIGLARFWLRRAAHHAPGPQERAMAIRAFRGLAGQQKLTAHVTAGVSPSSNINGGTSAETLVLDGIPLTLPPDLQALSGFTAQFGTTLRYKISEGPRHRTHLGANLQVIEHALSDSARDTAPLADASNYAFTGLEATMDHRFVPAGSKAAYGLSATLGHNWYGGQSLSNYLKLGANRDWSASPALSYRLGASAERQWRLDQEFRSATILGFGIDARLTRPDGDVLGFGASLRDTASQSDEIDHQAIRLSASYAWSRPVAGAQISAGLALEARDYTRSNYTTGGRQDLRASATLGLLFTEREYMGFAPQIELRAGRTDSNVSLFDTTDYGIGFALKSTF